MRRLNVSQNSRLKYLYYFRTNLRYIFVTLLLDGDNPMSIPQRIAFVRDFILQRFFPNVLEVRARNGEKPKSKYSRRKLDKILNNPAKTNQFLGMAVEKSNFALNQLVDFIKEFREHLNQEAINNLQNSNPQEISKLLRKEDIFLILQQFSQLSIQEKEQLGIIEESEGGLFADGSGVRDEVLLQQTLINTKLYDRWRHHESSLNFYRSSIGVDYVQEIYSQKPYDREQVDRWIERTIKEVLQDIPPELLNNTFQEFFKKVDQEVERILLQSGIKEVEDLSPNPKLEGSQFTNWELYYINNYLTPGYIQRLTQSVIENNLLKEELPIFLESVTIETIDDFPTLALSDVFDPKNLTEKDYHFKIDNLFPKRAYKVEVNCRVFFDRGINEESSIEFSLSSRGTGGTQSHIIKLINSMLFSGIPCLEDFFPIPHDVFINQEFIQYNVASTVWTHCFVKLCRNDVIMEAMRKSRSQNQLLSYEQCASINIVGRGDYCGFDTVDSTAKAAAHARLRAIRATGIDLSQYMKELKEKIEIIKLQRQAQSYVTSYPFSSLAKISHLQEHLLKEKCGKNQYQCVEILLQITETYLDEGSYQNAGHYLLDLSQTYKMSKLSMQTINWFNSFLNEKNSERVGSRSNLELLSSFISSSQLIRYEICRASYFYFLDRENNEQSSVWEQLIPEEKFKSRPTREIAWKTLDRAFQLLSVRFSKYYIINEVSQAVFDNHYNLLAKIFLLRSQLMLFFSREIGRKQYLLTDNRYKKDPSGARDLSSTQESLLYLLEKTRIYSCFDGDRLLYSVATSYQCWAYIMEHCISRYDNYNYKIKEVQIHLEKIKNLRNEALLSYANTGLECYNQIKANSGTSEELNKQIRHYIIDKIPPIREHYNSDQKLSEERGELYELYLDMSLLSVRTELLKPGINKKLPNIIFMFGVNSSYLLFIRGLYLLCTNFRYSSPEDEFRSERKDNSVKDLEKKFERAYQLLELAWATADDGGILESSEKNQYRFKRDFKVPAASESRIGEDGEIDSDSHYAASVRDLYPYRVPEIADFAKIFAAACTLLRLYTILDQDNKDNIRKRHEKDIYKLLNSLHRKKHCDYLKDKGDPFSSQDLYNGCFREIFKACKNILFRKLKTAKTYSYTKTPTDHLQWVQEQRDSLLKELFYTLYNPNQK